MMELLAADTRFFAIVLRTLFVSGTATAMAVLVGFPVGYGIARRSFRGRTLLLGFINTGMGMPPVVVGLVVGFTTASLQALPPRLADLLVVLGAGRVRTMWILAREAKLGLIAAITAA